MKKRKKPSDVLRDIKAGKTGMRRLIQDDIRDERAEYPRQIKRGLGEYRADLLTRPLFGLHKAARITEHLLYKTRFGKDSLRRFEEDADRLFFDVRQVESTLVHNWNGDAPLTKRAKDRLRDRLSEFAPRIEELVSAVCGTLRTPCPCCVGRGRIFGSVRLTEKVKDVLDKAVSDGILGYSESCGYYGI